MALKEAFVFVAPDVDPEVHRQTVVTPQVELMAVAVNNYAEAVTVCKELVEEGFGAIELCGGFGHIGAAKVAEAVGDKAAVGVVRFDNHPGLEFKSGDAIFR
ncbi:MAG: hypothetical protein DRI77_09980 [Chloroflexi bacterium]|nr:MAG: hypothetical protein DRI77_09980 [Chloroflexota bacterium]